MQGTAETRGVDATTTLKQAIVDASGRVREQTGSDEATLEAELLLCHALGIDRARLYQCLNDPIGEATNVFSAYVARRCAHEPTPYITGHREFFGLDLDVSSATLIPRPETETLVEAVIACAKERSNGAHVSIVDVGTGCGTIALAVAKALPHAGVIAIDESAAALELARRNAQRLGLAACIDFRLGDLLDPLTEQVDIIAANLPYVRTADWETLPPEIRDHEPREALDGGPDGLRVIERLLRTASSHLAPRGALFAEIGDGQAANATALAQASFPEATIQIADDLPGKARVLIVHLQ
jgi:release factor glutamine methyltransferase